MNVFDNKDDVIVMVVEQENWSRWSRSQEDYRLKEGRLTGAFTTRGSISWPSLAEIFSKTRPNGPVSGHQIPVSMEQARYR